ncbi:9355_t:CDS:1 [Gigaspora margarita]|uniref:9355_t:CDS:1 n=1 Tax=Gigaspora margarita TaxID=4874 RepID=A0ABN7UMA7_GIGMA|nr:9355_t:CDS:1 [Gigaspora margarita]
MLSGDDRLKILKNFNLNIIFAFQRATIIRELWDSFIDLYNNIHNKSNTTGNQFHQKARQWLKLILTKSQDNINSSGFVRGLYRPMDITPYIYILVYHVPEFIEYIRILDFQDFLVVV